MEDDTKIKMKNNVLTGIKETSNGVILTKGERIRYLTVPGVVPGTIMPVGSLLTTGILIRRACLFVHSSTRGLKLVAEGARNNRERERNKKRNRHRYTFVRCINLFIVYSSSK